MEASVSTAPSSPPTTTSSASLADSVEVAFSGRSHSKSWPQQSRSSQLVKGPSRTMGPTQKRAPTRPIPPPLLNEHRKVRMVNFMPNDAPCNDVIDKETASTTGDKLSTTESIVERVRMQDLLPVAESSSATKPSGPQNPFGGVPMFGPGGLGFQMRPDMLGGVKLRQAPSTKVDSATIDSSTSPPSFANLSESIQNSPSDEGFSSKSEVVSPSSPGLPPPRVSSLVASLQAKGFKGPVITTEMLGPGRLKKISPNSTLSTPVEVSSGTIESDVSGENVSPASTKSKGEQPNVALSPLQDSSFPTTTTFSETFNATTVSNKTV